MYHKCNWCSTNIKHLPLSTLDNTLSFCDIVCAKLYNDNIENININMKEYSKHYVSGNISTKAKKIYETTKDVMFKMLPRYKVDSNNKTSRMDAKIYYDKVLQISLKHQM